MNKLDELRHLAAQLQLDDQSVLDAIFAGDLVNLLNWMPAYDVATRLRGQKFADSILYNLVIKHTAIALDQEEIDLSRTLHGIRAVLNRHPDVNFAYARWLLTEEGSAVLEALQNKGLKTIEAGEKPTDNGDNQPS